MSKMQRTIYAVSLLFALGLSFLSVILGFRLGWPVDLIRSLWYFSLGLIVAANVYAAVALWRANRFDTLRRAGLRLLVMVVTLLVLFVIFR